MLQLQLFPEPSSDNGTESLPKCCETHVSLIPPPKTKDPARLFAPEFKVIRISESPWHGEPVERPDEVVAAWRKTIQRQPYFQAEKEHFAVFLVNTRRKLIGWNLVSIGFLDTVLCHPREIFRVACMRGCRGDNHWTQSSQWRPVPIRGRHQIHSGNH